ncbi:MAG: mechanosensitive ion channel [Spirochaetales bacterium]|nr:mechanosensitive ion channel [Spirochaetales bacterium]
MEKFNSFLESTGCRLISVVAMAVFGYLIVGQIIKQMKIGLLSSKIDNSLVNFILTFVRFMLLLALVLVCLANMGIPLDGVVGAISAATLAIGLALKDILSSVANGIMLVINCPFKENDYVEIGGVGGSVVEVKLMHTVLNTPDNKMVMIPNSQVYSASIVNYSKNETRRMDLKVGIDYSENPEKVRDILLDVAKRHPMVYTEPAPQVRYSYGDASSISFNVRVWCRNSDYWTVKWDLDEQLTRTLIDKGISIPFPQVTVSYRKEASK